MPYGGAGNGVIVVDREGAKIGEKFDGRVGNDIVGMSVDVVAERKGGKRMKLRHGCVGYGVVVVKFKISQFSKS